MGPSRRIVLALVLLVAVIGTVYLSSRPIINTVHELPFPDTRVHAAGLAPETADLVGAAIAPKLGNETVKAELGRAAWKLLHTTLARFPDRPNPDESDALKSYLYLFQRLYPCGECAEHFGQLLKKFPPQVSSRSAAAVWGCHIHNEVNKSLDKDLFDCAKIGDFYDCGCAEDEAKPAPAAKAPTPEETPVKKQALQLGSNKWDKPDMKSELGDKWDKPEMSEAAKEKLKENGRDFNIDLLTGARPLKLEKEGLTSGG